MRRHLVDQPHQLRLEEISKNLTTGRGKSFWYMLEPLLMSKAVYDGLSADAKKAIADVGESMQAFGLAEAKKDDEQIAGIYTKAGVAVADMDSAAIERWRKIARPRRGRISPTATPIARASSSSHKRSAPPETEGSCRRSRSR